MTTALLVAFPWQGPRASGSVGPMPGPVPSPAPRRTSDPRRPVAVGVLAGLLAPGGAACTNASDRFSGHWVTTAPVTLDGVDARIELGIGHYGPELVGVLRLEDPFGAPLPDCDCGVVEGALVGSASDAFTAFVESPCDEGAPGHGRWALSLTLDTDAEPRRLAGTVLRADHAPLEVVLEEFDAFVDPAFKACP
jgi:hypothetical protein